MILFFILMALVLVATVIGTIKGADDFADWRNNGPSVLNYIQAFFLWGFLSLFTALAFFAVQQSIASTLAQRGSDVTYSQQLATLKDGTGIEGQFYGGLFVSRGYVADTQVFSYYRVVAPNQYVLEKRNATQSTIWTDATNETARVDITDRVFTCEKTWYLSYCEAKPNEFVHANFHVPAGSIEQKYELDAQ
jgi:hypothetical protein